MCEREDGLIAIRPSGSRISSGSLRAGARRRMISPAETVAASTSTMNTSSTASGGANASPMPTASTGMTGPA